MSIKHHPDSSTLMSHAAGSLDEAFGAIVATHLDLCATCRSQVAEMELLGGALLDRCAPEEIEADRVGQAGEAFREAAKIYDLPLNGPAKSETSPDPVLPRPLREFIGFDSGALRWRRLAPGIRTVQLELSPDARGQLRLLEIAPGRKIPEHGHGGSEMTLVLSGAYRDASGRFARGDVEDVDEEVEHQPIVDEGEPCICLVATEAPARFKGLVSRVLQPLVGM